jgi:hypothetical protein
MPARHPPNLKNLNLPYLHQNQVPHLQLTGKLLLNRIEKLALGDNLRLAPDTAALAGFGVEDQRRKLGVIPEVGHGARGIDIDKDEGPIVNDTEGALNLDMGLAVLAGGGDEGGAGLGDYFLSFCG